MSTPQRIGLLKRAWHDVPEIMGSSFMGLIGVGLGLAGLYLYVQKDGDNRRYKMQYTVYRDDDPKAAKVRKD